jgi:hypothetical protein
MTIRTLDRTRPGAYEIPSSWIALLLARKTLTKETTK